MKKDPFKSCDIQLRVPFHDLDPLQIVWHGNYLKYFDLARFKLFEEADIDLCEFAQRERRIFPITKSFAKHVLPLKYKDEFICRAAVSEVNYKIAMNFEIRLLETNTLCARGKSEQVAVKVPEMTLEFEIPEEIRSALKC